jgi:anti-sigma B factor antagonist
LAFAEMLLGSNGGNAGCRNFARDQIRESKEMAELEVKERQAGDVTILDLSGSVRMGEGAVSLRNSIRSLVEQGKKKILLNLGGVKNVDSSGIGELIANYTTITRDGGQLKLLNLTEKIQNLLVITKLLTVFDSYDNEADALNTFK